MCTLSHPPMSYWRVYGNRIAKTLMQADTSSVRYFVATKHPPVSASPLRLMLAPCGSSFSGSYRQLVYSCNFLSEALPTKVFGTKDKILNATWRTTILPFMVCATFNPSSSSRPVYGTCGFLVDAGWSPSSMEVKFIEALDANAKLLCCTLIDMGAMYVRDGVVL